MDASISQSPPIERYVFGGVTYAEVVRAGATVSHSTFISAPDSSLQLGLLAHAAGFVEVPHVHKEIPRTIRDLQQFLVVQRGVIGIDFFDERGALLQAIELRPGDAILLMSGGHSLRVLEDAQCVSVKQGPFLGVENDKVPLPAPASGQGARS
jgi:hypothetical protein